MSFGLTDRTTALQRLNAEHFDVLVIGGGITGAGVVLEAASRGLRAALIERDDFASGTSSRSSKLLHGGLRYLRQYEFGLVAEGLRERRRLFRNAPHLAHPLTFTFPVIAGRTRRAARITALLATLGLWLYDALGGWRVGQLHKRIAVDEAARRISGLDVDRVTTAFSYVDGQADDARLTLAVLKTAAIEYDAPVANRMLATSITTDEAGRVTGVLAHDALTGTDLAIQARTVVNATGVWADAVHGANGLDPLVIRPAKGVHITVPRDRLSIEGAAILEVQGSSRVVFVIPWDDVVYIGTTDTDYDGDRDEPFCTAADVASLLEIVNGVRVTSLTADDVTASWAGLRPLLVDPRNADAPSADVSRRHVVLDDGNGLVTVTGGKLTAYREMAEDTVDTLRAHLPDVRVRRSRTKKLPLHGGPGTAKLRADGAAERLGISRSLCTHLVDRYGGHTPAVAKLIHDDPALGELLVPGLPYVRAEAIYAARFEMVTTLADVLERRTRALMVDRAATVAAAPAVAALIGPDLGWDADEQQRQVTAFLVYAEREAAAQHTV